MPVGTEKVRMMRALLTAAVLSAIVAASVGDENRKPWSPHDPSAASGTEAFHHTRRLNRPRRSTCGKHIEASRGTITSPNFPDFYPERITCEWLITAPPSFYVVLNFTNFELEPNDDCKYDNVTIYTEDKDGTDHTYGPFCGSTLPPQITSKISKLRLHFSSDVSTQMSGFMAVFHMEPNFDTAKVELNSSTYPNASVLLSWAWHDASVPGTNFLAGYHLRGASTKHTFQKTLSPLMTNYTENCLHGYTEYEISLQPFFKVEGSATADERLGEVATVKVKTPATALRAPSFTTAEAVGADSIQLQWELSLLPYADVPQYEIRLYDGERFRSRRTINTSLRVTNLAAETTYAVEIRAFFEGTRQMGPPARTTVTTWSLRPLKPTVDVKLDDGSDVVIMSWTFLNSTVNTLQVDNGGYHWQDCSAVAECTYTVQRGWNSSFKTGFLEMRNSRRAANYTLLIRGCNSHGCGPPAVANVKKGVPEREEVADLGFIQFDNSSGLLNWSVQSDQPAEYIASWHCDDGEHFGEITTNLEVEVTGLPPDKKECTFSVAEFRRLQSGAEVHGKTSTIFVSW